MSAKQVYQLDTDTLQKYLNKISVELESRGVQTPSAEVRDLKQEVQILRDFGNKDCTAMADDALQDARYAASDKQ